MAKSKTKKSKKTWEGSKEDNRIDKVLGEGSPADKKVDAMMERRMKLKKQMKGYGKK